MLALQLHSLKQVQVCTANQLILDACHNGIPTVSFLFNIASGSPFFLYLAFQHTHHPQFSGKRFTNTTIRGMFGDAITEMDWAVGQVVETLKTSKVDNNTFIFFTADNG